MTSRPTTLLGPGACLLTASLLALPAHAAPQGQLWLEGGLGYRVDKHLEIRLDQLLRFDNDFARAGVIAPELGMQLRLNKHLRLGAGYRLVFARAGNGDFRAGHRFFFDARVRLRLHDVRLELRERFQERFDNRGLQPTLRHRLDADYRGWSAVTPYLSAELFTRFGARTSGRFVDDGFRVHKWRFTAGGSLDAGDHEVDLFYRIELFVSDDTAPTLHILGLAYHLGLDRRELFDAPEEPPRTQVVSINPLGPLTAIVAEAARVDLADFNAAYSRAFSDTLGMRVVFDFGYAKRPLSTYRVGLRLGPRFSLSHRWLEGWYLAPAAVLGATWTASWDGEALGTAAVLGAAVESGYAWRWDGFVFEIGGGVVVSGLVGIGTARASVGPLINTSLGYAW